MRLPHRPTCGQRRTMSGVRRVRGMSYNLRLLSVRGAMMLRKFVLLAALLACGAALADEASVRKLVEAKLGNKVQSVTRTP